MDDWIVPLLMDSRKAHYIYSNFQKIVSLLLLLKLNTLYSKRVKSVRVIKIIFISSHPSQFYFPDKMSSKHLRSY